MSLSTARQLTPDELNIFDHDGYVIARALLSKEALHALQYEIDCIMLGTADVRFDDLLMELDSLSEVKAEYSPGFKGATLAYKRIQQLEISPVVRRYIESPVFRHACAWVYGDRAVSLFRAMLVNKLPGRGASIGWHQDCWNYLDTNPLLTVWTALDSIDAENGGLRVLPGSHKHRHISKEDRSGFLTEAMVDEYCRDREVVHLAVEPGDVVLLHNHLLHASDRNISNRRRRAISVCYMDAATRNVFEPVTYPIVFAPDIPITI